MASEESFSHVEPPSSIGHGSTRSPTTSNLQVPNAQGRMYVRVGRGIVPVDRYDNNLARRRSTAGDLATRNAHGIDGEISPPGATTKPKWYKPGFLRSRHLSFHSTSSRRITSINSTGLNKSPTIPQTESPVVDVAPVRMEVVQNEASPIPGPSKLRKPQSRNQLHPVHMDQRNLASSTPPPTNSARDTYIQSSGAQEETEEDRLRDGQLLLDLYGVNDAPPAPPLATEQAQPHRLPTPNPEPGPEPEVEREPEIEPDQASAPRVRRLPPVPAQVTFPVPVLNIIPPHDSQDAFTYVFGPNYRSSYVECRGPTSPPPYVARQSAILDPMRHTRGQPILPDQKREAALPSVAPLTIRKDKSRN